MEHELKSHQSYFQAVWDRKKLFEIRVNDRGFNAGDKVVLNEVYESGVNIGRKTYRYIYANISYVTGFMQKEGYVVFQMKNLRNWKDGGL